ncbi:unnamed protein product [Brachionus calyciflorus]|uniref:Uncharacterized protein n=1 Tax=Brachionus calyciflorus TaxID=104777 RepID=A0A814D3B2_9BILA|nr:unnamed protein product [Brachionus calyciflorus]
MSSSKIITRERPTLNFEKNERLNQLELIFNQISGHKTNDTFIIKLELLRTWFEQAKILDEDFTYFSLEDEFKKILEILNKIEYLNANETFLDYAGFLLLLDSISSKRSIQPIRLILALINGPKVLEYHEHKNRKYSLFNRIDETTDDQFISSTKIKILNETEIDNLF